MELVKEAVTAVPGSSRPEPDLQAPLIGRRTWRINCGDVVDRERSLTVLVERNRVVLVGPPGETAVLTPGQLSQLRTALREAAEQAER